LNIFKKNSDVVRLFVFDHSAAGEALLRRDRFKN